MRITHVVVALAVSLLTAVAAAQESCALPQDIQPIAPLSPDQVNHAVTDYYAFVLSWSPEHCASVGTQHGQSKHRFQCVDNSFHFVVHGLWPQSNKGKGKSGHPRHCNESESLPASLLREHLCTVPGVYLMQNEWQAHGTCAWERPEDYFDQIETLFEEFKAPAYEDFGTGSVTVKTIKDAFIGLNPELRANNLVVTVVKGGKNRLREVWICLDKKFDPIACKVTGAPESQALTVRAPRPTQGSVFAASLPNLAPVDPLTAESPVDLVCPQPQTKFNNYSAGKNAFWTNLYPDGGSTIYCGAPFSGKRTNNGLMVNIEHVVPQAHLPSASSKGDLHNLYPSIAKINSSRDSYPFVENIPGEFWNFASSAQGELSSCDFEMVTLKQANGQKTGVVEPAPSARGPLARASLHMYLAYPGNKLSPSQIELFLAWNETHPVTDEEVRRNDLIEAVQGTRNPFIDSPENAEAMVVGCEE